MLVMALGLVQDKSYKQCRSFQDNFLKKYFYFIYMYAYVHASAFWSCLVWVLGTQLGSSGRATGNLNC